MNKIAVCHPGKLGDAIYTLPTIKKLKENLDCEVDFYTSLLCEPLRRLFEYQSCISTFNVIEHGILNMGQGVQPWKMNVDESQYSAVYQLGFEYFPNRQLHESIGRSAGLDSVGAPFYEYPHKDNEFLEPYIVVVPTTRGTIPDSIFKFIIDTSPLQIVQLGASGEFIPGNSIDRTGLDFLDTLPILEYATGFISIMTAMLTLANGFPNLKKVILCTHDGNMLYAENNFYREPHIPAEEIFNLISGAR